MKLVGIAERSRAWTKDPCPKGFKEQANMSCRSPAVLHHEAAAVGACENVVLDQTVFPAAPCFIGLPEHRKLHLKRLVGHVLSGHAHQKVFRSGIRDHTECEVLSPVRAERMKPHRNRFGWSGLPDHSTEHRGKHDEANDADDKAAPIHSIALLQKKRSGRNAEVLCL